MFRRKPITNEWGVFIQERPKKQDVKPKAFQTNPFIMLQFAPEISQRWMLWFLAHYPYYNSYLIQDWFNWLKPKDGLPFPRYVEVQNMIALLKSKGFIREDRQHTAWNITLNGWIYRITTHVAFPIIGVSSAVIAICSFIAHLIPTPSPPTTPAKDTMQAIITSKQNDNSAQNTSAQIDSLKVKDSSLMRSDTTKTFRLHSDTLKKG